MNRKLSVLGSLWLGVLVVVCCPCPLFGQYVYVSSVSNSASYYGANLPGYGIAQGSLMVLFGYQMGPGQLVQSPGFPLPLILSETLVTVTVNGITRTAPILYTSAGQVAALLPSSTPVGSGTLTVTYKGTASYPIGIVVVPSAFGIYSLISNGLGLGVFTTPDYKVKTLADSFRPNDVVVLWGTGLGAVAGDDTAGPLPGQQFPGAEIYVGNQRAKVLYAGRSGCCGGLDQINFEIPAGVEGCFVPVAVRNGGVTSNFVSIPIASGGGACSEKAGIPADLLRSAQSGQPLKLSAVWLGPIEILQGIGYSLKSTVAGRLSGALHMKVTEKQVLELLRATSPERQKAILSLVKQSTPNTLERLARLRAVGRIAAGLDQQGSAGTFGQVSSLSDVVTSYGEILPPPGSCTVYSGNGLGFQKTGFDAGPELILTGPLGTRSLTRAEKGQYQTSFGGGFNSGQLPAGTYSVSSIGGADVGPFTASITVPGNLRWTNKPASAAVDRTVPLDVTWSGGAGSGYVVFGGSATYNQNGVTRMFACVEDISKGRLTVPTFVLGALPPAASGKGYLFLGDHPMQNRFSAKGLDTAFIAVLDTDNLAVTFR